LYIDVGFEEEEAIWLANFGDNPIEWFTQYNVRFSLGHRRHLDQQAQSLGAEIEKLKSQVSGRSQSNSNTADLEKKIQEATALLEQIESARARWSLENFEKLSAREKNIHLRAFATNADDPFYHELTVLKYQNGANEQELRVPKGDLLHQFRHDVDSGNLPTVSWLVAPQAFSDHPDSAWYGAWYIAEALNILTRNPAVWKKTIFILTYDENDGYFDHVPPFVAPDPRRRETGLVSEGINAEVEYVHEDQEKARSSDSVRESSIGLGYRVPMIIASPWSRGGCVCSQVFDHTSPLQFLEKLLTHKTGKEIRETNISDWRRAVCGDLTSAFQGASDGSATSLSFPARDAFLEQIHRAQFKQLPSGFRALSALEIDQVRKDPATASWMPRQEAGVRRSCALPYQLTVDGNLSDNRRSFAIQFEAGNELFGERSAGSPFTVYARLAAGDLRTRNYAVAAGSRLEDSWLISEFELGKYHLAVYGPNGFCREFQGSTDDPPVEVRLGFGRSTSGEKLLTGTIEVQLINRDSGRSCAVNVHDAAYKSGDLYRVLEAGESATLVVSTERSFGWYDLRVRVADDDRFEKRYAGRVETGQWSFSDPMIGRA
jgi:phospholipase C